MASKAAGAKPRDVIATVAESEAEALDAVRRFVETVDRALPGGGTDEDPSRRVEIIDAALQMVERLLSASNDLASRVVKTVEHAVSDARPKAPAKKTPAKKTAAKKAPAKKAAAKKAPAKKAPAKKAGIR